MGLIRNPLMLTKESSRLELPRIEQNWGLKVTAEGNFGYVIMLVENSSDNDLVLYENADLSYVGFWKFN
jgi:hypothetical protein